LSNFEKYTYKPIILTKKKKQFSEALAHTVGDSLPEIIEVEYKLVVYDPMTFLSNKWPLLLGSCNASTSLARVLTENQLKFIARACQTIRGCSHKNASEKQCHHSNHL